MKPLKERLTSLGLRHTSDTLDDLVATATKRRWRPTELLDAIADQESQDKARRSVERRLAHSRLGALTPMASFDWGWPKRIDRAAVDSALQLDFIARPANVVLVAPQGLGKIMIAQNIAYNAVQAGHSVLFTTASQLLLDLGCQDSARALDRRLKHYCSQAGLLVIDEIGYLSCDAQRRPALPGRLSPLREEAHRFNNPSALQRVVLHLPQRSLRRRPHRPRHPPRQH